MASNKYKIRITDIMDELLENDMLLFGFFNNNKLNKNLFYNTIICNMYSFYKTKRNYIHGYITYILEDYIEDSNLTFDIAKGINNASYTDVVTDNADFPLTRELYVYPTNETRCIFNEIEINELTNMTMSDFIRMLLSSYIYKPIFNREAIIFKDEYNIIDKAISEEKIVYVGTNDDEFYFEPYFFTYHKKTFHTYILGYKITENKREKVSVMLKDIYEFTDTFKHYKFSRDLYNALADSMEYGPEYVNEDELTAIIHFNDNSLQKIYNKKLTNLSIDSVDKENNIVTIRSNMPNIFEFLIPFGKDIKVIEPIELKNKLNDFYRAAINE